MARRNESILDLLVLVPWKANLILAAVVLVFLCFVVPSLTVHDPFWKAAASVAPALGWVLAALFVVMAACSALMSFQKRKLLDGQSGIDSIRDLHWKEFEELLGEAYRRRGYRVAENVGRGSDGGVDLRVEKGGNTYLVQCKQWKAFKVPVGVVREILGIMASEKAAGVIVVTSGMFTQEARDFAEGQPVELIEGDALAEMIRNVQSDRPASAGATSNAPGPKPAAPPETRMLCPRCGKELVVREAHKGPHAGKKFWGCQGYPACKYIRNLEG